jgi:hypothetical protein
MTLRLVPPSTPSHGNHRRILRIDLARHDGLQRQHNLRRQHDRIAGVMRIGAMPAHTAHENIHGIDIGKGVARRIADRPPQAYPPHRETRSRLRAWGSG